MACLTGLWDDRVSFPEDCKTSQMVDGELLIHYPPEIVVCYSLPAIVPGKRFSVDTAQGKVTITAQTGICRRLGATACVLYDSEFTARNTSQPIPENQHV
jgi:hypothetical protein